MELICYLISGVIVVAYQNALNTERTAMSHFYA